MRLTPILSLTSGFIAACICFLATNAMAQTSAAKKPVKKPAASTTSTTKRSVAPAAPVAAAAPVALTQEQLSIAQIVQTGRVQCAEGQSVTITPDAKTNGAFDLQFGSVRYDVVPVATKSGAIRLEDTRTGVVFMQLANKSMLFNERQGKRLADDCISPAQQAVADSMRANPPVSVLDAPGQVK